MISKQWGGMVSKFECFKINFLLALRRPEVAFLLSAIVTLGPLGPWLFVALPRAQQYAQKAPLAAITDQERWLLILSILAFGATSMAAGAALKALLNLWHWLVSALLFIIALGGAAALGGLIRSSLSGVEKMPGGISSWLIVYIIGHTFLIGYVIKIPWDAVVDKWRKRIAGD